MDNCKGGVGVAEAKATARKKDSEGEAREKEDKGKKEKRNVGRNRTVPEARRLYCLLGNGKGRFRWGCETGVDLESGISAVHSPRVKLRVRHRSGVEYEDGAGERGLPLTIGRDWIVSSLQASEGGQDRKKVPVVVACGTVQVGRYPIPSMGWVAGRGPSGGWLAAPPYSFRVIGIGRSWDLAPPFVHFTSVVVYYPSGNRARSSGDDGEQGTTTGILKPGTTRSIKAGRVRKGGMETKDFSWEGEVPSCAGVVTRFTFKKLGTFQREREPQADSMLSDPRVGPPNLGRGTGDGDVLIQARSQFFLPLRPSPTTPLRPRPPGVAAAIR
ncbi:hypothetical protein FA13DRAFT_1710170 [Coprinellus micaceus]|uniref:Uncharacterized protein n=1 Tax=Coprinellus micaceus TaxID=71717 RepID=A0A4Y7T9S4_COPMI|nr:hypothetical protein FA13DRAFT_1710170 [Coprinellus micaceus]